MEIKTKVLVIMESNRTKPKTIIVPAEEGHRRLGNEYRRLVREALEQGTLKDCRWELETGCASVVYTNGAHCEMFLTADEPASTPQEEKGPVDVYYEEVLIHKFTVDAASAEDAEEAFNRAAADGELDFSDGEVVSTSVFKVQKSGEDPVALNMSHADLERLVFTLRDYIDTCGKVDRSVFLDLEELGLTERDFELLGFQNKSRR